MTTELDCAATSIFMAEDIYDPDGLLLVRSGTVLSNRVLARLNALIAASGHAVRLRVGESVIGDVT